MKKILILLFCLGLFILYETSTSFFSSPEHSNAEEKNQYTFKTFPTSKEGWGYSIMKEGKQVIRQNQIPAVQGNVLFANEADAAKVAKLVVSKLNASEIPTVTISELAALRISIK